MNIQSKSTQNMLFLFPKIYLKNIDSRNLQSKCYTKFTVIPFPKRCKKIESRNLQSKYYTKYAVSISENM